MYFETDDNEDGEIIKENLEDNDFKFKIVILGYIAVGKSCLLHKVLEDEFIEDYNSTQGFDFCNFIVKVKDTRIRFNICELTGNEEMRKAFLSSIRNINLAIIVYSIENKKSFEYIDTLYKEIKNHESSLQDIILVGNKTDLEEKRE